MCQGHDCHWSGYDIAFLIVDGWYAIGHQFPSLMQHSFDTSKVSVISGDKDEWKSSKLIKTYHRLGLVHRF